jgi:hypothetical protein
MASERTRVDYGYYLSIENEFVLSENENTIIFITDRVLPSVLLRALNQFDTHAHIFRDFTNFTNANNLYDSTTYAMPFLLTGHRYDHSLDMAEHRDNIWNDPGTLAFYESTGRAGYEFHLFLPPRIIVNSPEQLKGIADNLTYGSLGEINQRYLIREMMRLSAFLYAPFVMKESLQIEDGSFRNVVLHESEYICDDPAFFERLKTTKISTQSEHNMFIFIHLTGSHGDYIRVDEFGNVTQEALPGYRHAAGTMWIIGEYLNQMRELGIYDNSNILIFADNARMGRPDIAMMAKRAGVSQDSFKNSDAPVCQSDIWATLAAMMNLDIAVDFGFPLFDVPEDYQRTRTLSSPMQIFDFPNPHVMPNAIAVFEYDGHITDVPTFSPQTRRHPNQAAVFEDNPGWVITPIGNQ